MHPFGIHTIRPQETPSSFIHCVTYSTGKPLCLHAVTKDGRQSGVYESGSTYHVKKPYRLVREPPLNPIYNAATIRLS